MHHRPISISNYLTKVVLRFSAVVSGGNGVLFCGSNTPHFSSHLQIMIRIPFKNGMNALGRRNEVASTVGTNNEKTVVSSELFVGTQEHGGDTAAFEDTETKISGFKLSRELREKGSLASSLRFPSLRSLRKPQVQREGQCQPDPDDGGSVTQHDSAKFDEAQVNESSKGMTPLLRGLRVSWIANIKAPSRSSMQTSQLQHLEQDGSEEARPKTSRIAKASLLRIPNRLDFNEKTELVNGTFKISGQELNYFLEDGTLLLQARKQLIGKVYTIYDMREQGSPIEVATFSRAWLTKEAVAYRLAVGQTNVDIACVVFENCGLMTKFLESPNRHLDLVINVTRDSDLPKSSTIVLDSQSRYEGKHSLHKMDDPSKLVQVFPTKSPYNGNTGENVLWFKGRGKESSVKNVQLIDTMGRVTWQMAQVSRAEYHVDFRAPLNPLQAFATALGQQDL